jgi:hypothetical protein
MFGNDPESTVRKMREVIEEVTGIVIEDWAKLVESELQTIKLRLDTIEGASPLRANSEQPLVGPPGKTEERPAALARPASLAELKTWAEDTILLSNLGSRRQDKYWAGVRKTAEKVLQWLGTLDQGPAAQCPSEVEVQKRAWHPNSEHSH